MGLWRTDFSLDLPGRLPADLEVPVAAHGAGPWGVGAHVRLDGDRVTARVNPRRRRHSFGAPVLRGRVTTRGTGSHVEGHLTWLVQGLSLPVLTVCALAMALLTVVEARSGASYAATLTSAAATVGFVVLGVAWVRLWGRLRAAQERDLREALRELLGRVEA